MDSKELIPTNPLPDGREEVRRAGRTSGAISVLSVLSYGLNVVRAMLVARFFGLSSAVDAFYLALAVPLFVEGLFLGAFQSVFIPAYLRVEARDEAAARDLARRSVFAGLGLLSLLGLLIVAAAGPVLALVGGGFDPSTRAEATSFLRYLALLLVLEGGSQCFGALLQARRRYLLPVAASLASLVASLAWLLWRVSSGPFVLVEASLAGGFLSLTLMGLTVAPSLARRTGVDRPTRERIGWKNYGVVLLAFALTGINPIVDQALATHLTTGDVAAYGYATRLYEVVWQLVFAGAGLVLLPLFAGQIARERSEDVRKTLRATFQASFLFFAPITLAVAIAGRPFVSTLLERGAFDRTAAVRVWSIWSALSPALLLAAWGTVLNRFLYALGATRAVLVASAVNVGINAAADYALMRVLGVVGIGLATSVRAAATVLVLWALVPTAQRRLLPLRGEGCEYGRALLALLPLLGGSVWLSRSDLPPALYGAGLAGLAAIQLAAFRVSNPDWVGRLIALARGKSRAV